MTITIRLAKFVLLVLFLTGGAALTVLPAQESKTVSGFYVSETGKTVFRVIESGGTVQVEVYKVASDANAKTKENLGKVVFDGMRREPGTQVWSGGKAYTYKGKQRVEQGTCTIETVQGGKQLKVSVRAGLIGRTVIWNRVSDPEGALK